VGQRLDPVAGGIGVQRDVQIRVSKSVRHGILVRLQPGAVFPPGDQRVREFYVPSRRGGSGSWCIGPPVELAELRVGQRFIVPAGASKMNQDTLGCLQGVVGLDVRG
jgi:hypothetical protein